MIKNKKILLAVCGSISFYKAYEILSLLKKDGADVYVALSDGALKFCSVAGWEALTPHPVLCSQTENWQAGVNHINYAKMDLILIAPASANTINKLASGVCDNVFLQTLIASDAPVLIAPAANNKMLTHFATQRSFEFLKACGVEFIDPVEKVLACGDVGKGALADTQTIIYAVKRKFCEPKFRDKKVVITGGATSESIDDVRAITNFSSGKMARALADAFYFAGADVVLAASFESANLPYAVRKFKSSVQLLKICEQECENADLLVMTAAVSDYVPEVKFEGKLKKQEFGESWRLNLRQNIDILGALAKFDRVKKIAFKMETDALTAENSAREMLAKKRLDAVCLNVLGTQNSFGSDQNEVKFITQDGVQNLALAPKSQIAAQIVNLATKI